MEIRVSIVTGTVEELSSALREPNVRGRYNVSRYIARIDWRVNLNAAIATFTVDGK